MNVCFGSCRLGTGMKENGFHCAAPGSASLGLVVYCPNIPFYAPVQTAHGRNAGLGHALLSLKVLLTTEREVVVRDRNAACGARARAPDCLMRTRCVLLEAKL